MCSSGKARAERALLLEKRRISSGETTVEVVVDERPVRAGIDPYNKLIDRESNDNVIRVTRGTRSHELLSRAEPWPPELTTEDKSVRRASWVPDARRLDDDMSRILNGRWQPA